MTIVALPAPTPYAGLPEPYAAFTIAGPPVAIVRSQTLISSRASGMLGRSTHCSEIRRRARCLERRAHHADGLVGRPPAGRVRRENHRVLALDRVDRHADRRDVGAGHRNQRRDHACRLRVFDDALLGDLLDDAHALLTERVAKDAEHLRAAARLAAAHAAFVDAHVRQPGRRRLVAAGPRDGAAEPIDRSLVVPLHGPHGVARAREQRPCGRAFLRGNGSGLAGSDCHNLVAVLRSLEYRRIRASRPLG